MSAMHSSIDWSGPTNTTLRSMMPSTRVCGDARPFRDVGCIVPLGDDADYFGSIQHEDQRANVLVGHHLHCIVDFVAGMDGPYLMALLFVLLTGCRHDGTKKELKKDCPKSPLACLKSATSRHVHPHAANSSSRVFACFRSGVSKPSVNQP